jgi:hypothetical protein
MMRRGTNPPALLARHCPQHYEEAFKRARRPHFARHGPAFDLAQPVESASSAPASILLMAKPIEQTYPSYEMEWETLETFLKQVFPDCKFIKKEVLHNNPLTEHAS